MLKEVHSLIDGLKIKDEAIKVRFAIKFFVDINWFTQYELFKVLSNIGASRRMHSEIG